MTLMSKPVNILLKVRREILVFRRLLPDPIRNLFYGCIVLLKNMLVSRIRSNSSHKESISQLQETGFVSFDSIDSSVIKTINTSLKNMPKKDILNSRGEVVKELYCNSVLSENQILLSLATNDKVLSILSEYFGCIPKIQYLAAWRTLQNEDELSEMFFHMDHHGHKFAKFFLYLTDVNEGDGHHEFVLGSHDWRSFKRTLQAPSLRIVRNGIYAKRKYQGRFWLNNEAITRFLPDRVKKVTGGAGSLFLEDTGGLHRGTRVTSGKPRMIFQALYTPMDSGKDNAVKGSDLEAFELCKQASDLDDKQFEEVCSMILRTA